MKKLALLLIALGLVGVEDLRAESETVSMNLRLAYQICFDPNKCEIEPKQATQVMFTLKDGKPATVRLEYDLDYFNGAYTSYSDVTLQKVGDTYRFSAHLVAVTSWTVTKSEVFDVTIDDITDPSHIEEQKIFKTQFLDKINYESGYFRTVLIVGGLDARPLREFYNSRHAVEKAVFEYDPDIKVSN